MRGLLWVFLAGCASRQGAEVDVKAYGSAANCEGCHRKLFVQHRFSMHHLAFEAPLFQAQLYENLLPAAEKNPRLAREAKSCLSCHSPITWLQGGKELVPRVEVRREFSGVTCDFCHTVAGFRGAEPGNANFVPQPGEPKFGPLKQGSDHHTYLALQTKSEFCGVCHAAQNTLGVETIATYSEWKASAAAKRGVQCQDCHMSTRGFSVDGAPGLDSGEGLSLTLVASREPVKRTHHFPGAHAGSQLSGAMEITVRDRRVPLVPGQKLTIEVAVNNSRAGHKMPTGSALLRLLWLEVRVGFSDDTVTELLQALPTDAARPLDVAYASPPDAKILGADVPAGARLYRSVYADAAGAHTQESWLAAKEIFDSRLESGEVRTERFEYTVPADVREGQALRVEASLKYLTAPSAYYRRFGLPPRQVVVVAADTGLIGTPADERELRPPAR